ncbi:LysR substrate-binding domain-containing protein [Micrococcoides hystricis]|uniref:LysR substrate-binding domain-containing protein n=1 Tax=Micrococcoides hystricis TaxID=1572761 RepID=A0ABV6P8S9_9MICC
METRQLKYFIAVAEEKHFGRAAERLMMAQPPLSQQIKNLETELGVQLFNRTTRKVELTEAGELMLERGQSIINAIEALEQDVKHVADGAQGVLRVGFTGAATYRHMPWMVEQARLHFPRLRLDIQGEMLTPQMEQGLLEHRFDVAVLRPPVHSQEIETMLIEEEELVVALPEESELAAKGTIDLADLATVNFVAYPQGSAVHQVTLRACQEHGFVPNVVQRVRETSTMLALVAANVGVGLIPASTKHSVIRGMVLRPLRNPPRVDLSLAWLKSNTSPLVKNFRTLYADYESTRKAVR